mmetsp:Transcript_6283/g.25487  ORF Transcript_6283/g.25487 Transcript_6283/m.25487 type:complete len:292 (+) Transcript_6283:2106-2981(+)
MGPGAHLFDGVPVGEESAPALGPRPPLRQLPHHRAPVANGRAPALDRVDRINTGAFDRVHVRLVDAGVDEVQEKVGRRLEHGTAVADVGEPAHDAAGGQRPVRIRLVRRTRVHLSSVREQHALIEQRHDGRPGLVDGRDHRRSVPGALLSVCDVAEFVAHEQRGGGVEPRSGLVQQQELGPVDALHGDDEPALLAAADASLTDDADRRVRRAGQIEIVDGALDDFLDGLGPRLGFAGFITVNFPARETQSRGEHERLFRRERVEENVLLRDVPQVAQQASRVWVNLAVNDE